MTWSQAYLLFGGGLFASAAIAAIPIAIVFVLLGVLRKPSWVAGISGLGATLLLALVGYHMPMTTAASAACEGVAFGLFPISWIVFWAICLFRVTLETGKFEIIKNSVGHLTIDPRLQTLLIAFAFGAFVEGAAGFGTPVAIASTMLTGLGFTAFDASALCLLANTAPVAFGSIGIPIVTLALTTNLPVNKLSATAGILCTPVAFILPGYLLGSRWGLRGLREMWFPAIVTGTVFAGVQLFVSNLLGAQLTDILASLAAICALIAVIKFWFSHKAAKQSSFDGTSAQSSHHVSIESAAPTYSRAELIEAWLPYGLLVVCVLLWGWAPVHKLLERMSVSFPWPLLHDVVLRVPPIVAKPSPYHAIFNFNWFAASGTSCMTATLLTAICFRMPPAKFGKLLLAVTRQLALPTVTVTSVLAMAFVMNYSGATATLGLAFAATGALFPFFSALLGWLGVFLTGSDTSSNALFGTLQTVTAGRLGLNPITIAAVNSIGGVMGKMISLQTIAVAAAATGISVRDQAKLFRFTLRHSLLLVVFVGVLALLAAYIHI
ncbi:MAG TPA: lactate permease LctP family transporter [Terracidiphilus sp.]|nr:lactate permease LctP family transporter [Terracidiphilus sp.]